MISQPPWFNDHSDLKSDIDSVYWIKIDIQIRYFDTSVMDSTESNTKIDRNTFSEISMILPVLNRFTDRSADDISPRLGL